MTNIVLDALTQLLKLSKESSTALTILTFEWDFF